MIPLCPCAQLRLRLECPYESRSLLQVATLLVMYDRLKALFLRPRRQIIQWAHNKSSLMLMLGDVTSSH